MFTLSMHEVRMVGHGPFWALTQSYQNLFCPYEGGLAHTQDMEHTAKTLISLILVSWCTSHLTVVFIQFVYRIDVFVF